MKHKVGFTLIELLIVVSVTALLLAIIIPARKPHPMSPHRKTYRNISEIRWPLDSYYCENNKWPDESNWKENLKEFIKAKPYTNPEELDYFIIDGWKNPIQYRIIEEDGTQKVLLYSYGKNKTDDNGTGDDITRKIEPPTPEEIESYKKNQ